MLKLLPRNRCKAFKVLETGFEFWFFRKRSRAHLFIFPKHQPEGIMESRNEKEEDVRSTRLHKYCSRS